MLDGTRLEDVPRPFEPEDLRDAFPLLAKPGDARSRLQMI
jgi:hypothetical protein